MLVVGGKVYAECEEPVRGLGFAGMLSCPFQGDGAKPRELWCRACLLAKINSLELVLRNMGQMAKDAAASRY